MWDVRVWPQQNRWAVELPGEDFKNGGVGGPANRCMGDERLQQNKRKPKARKLKRSVYFGFALPLPVRVISQFHTNILKSCTEQKNSTYQHNSTATIQEQRSMFC